MLASPFPAIACFDLGYPEYGRGSVFIPFPCEMGGEALGFHLLVHIEQEVTMKD